MTHAECQLTIFYRIKQQCLLSVCVTSGVTYANSFTGVLCKSLKDALRAFRGKVHYHYLVTLMLFQTCMSFFFLRKE